MLIPLVLMTPLTMPSAETYKTRGCKFRVCLAADYQNMASTDFVEIVVYNPLASARDSTKDQEMS